ncbi:unnamed protein product [Discula destructiva]
MMASEKAPTPLDKDAAVVVNSKPESDLETTSLPNEADDGETNWSHISQQIPWQYKIFAFVCIVALPVGQTWTQASISPLKNTLREELDVTNTQFGIISSADAFVNTVFPIVGGMLLDWWGPNIITLCCTSVIVVGSIIAALATNLGLWRMLVGGHILMGFGIAVLDSAQQKFFYHWFGSDGLAFPFGLENAVSSTISLVGGMTAIPIRDGTGWYGWSFWIPVVMCVFSFAVNILYVLVERTMVPSRFRLTSERDRAITSEKLAVKKIFSWRVLLTLPWAYLMMPATQLLQSGAAGGFSVNSADIIFMRGYTEAVAGYLSTGQKILPILLSPLIGLFIDAYGHRFHFVATAPVLWIIACALLGWSTVHPLAALVFSSLAGSINSMPLQICIPLLVADQAKLGTAFGLWRAFNNSGSTIMDVVFGVLQDGTENQGYSKVLTVAIAIKVVAFVAGLSYIFVDYKYLGKGMTMTRKQRQAREAAIVDPATDPLTKREVKGWFTALTFVLLVGIVVAAWAVFMVYLVV